MPERESYQTTFDFINQEGRMASLQSVAAVITKTLKEADRHSSDCKNKLGLDETNIIVKLENHYGAATFRNQYGSRLTSRFRMTFYLTHSVRIAIGSAQKSEF